MVDGGLNNIGPIHDAMLRLRLVIGFQTAGNGDGLIADIVDPPLQNEAEPVARLTFDQVFPHVRTRGRGGLAVEIDKTVKPFLRQEDLHAAEARDAAHLRVDDALDQRDRDGGVDGISAASQDLDSGFAGLGLRGADEGLGFHLN